MVAVTLRGRREVLRLAGAVLATATFGMDEDVRENDDLREAGDQCSGGAKQADTTVRSPHASSDFGTTRAPAASSRS